MPAQTTQLYYRYDWQDDRIFKIDTLEEHRFWLAEWWEMYPNEDMDDDDIEQMKKEIMQADEEELEERMIGIEFGFYRCDEHGNELENSLRRLRSKR
ncbi:hypothetical protein [Terribacillus saccharophilus]|uniref:hypothetical protein n=1 Tax=Terribacillus saccharophilus TaxID=361277 RepID=UPI002989BF7B|nr:hypothetical protein [Terribacillus saccharophilus]MCM3227713.1 hypothetical protein [Terribacillus saccharophilus]